MSDNPAALPKRDKFSFSFALMGQTMIFNVVNLYLMIFYTDIFGLSAALVGTIFLVARIWDAVNDPIMGVVVDKTVTKWGKCRPYLLWFPAPIALITFLLFLSPNLGSTGKIIYASITYILWGMFYTAVDIPLWTMSSRMTVDSSQRQSTIAWGRVFNILGSFFPVLLFVPLKNALGGGNEAKGFTMAALVFCLVALPLMIQSFWGTRERAPMAEEKKPTLKENLRAITHNKPLMLLLTSTVLAVFVGLPVSAGIYFVTYNLGDEGLFAVLAGTVLTSAVIGSALAPMLARKFPSRDILIWANLLSAALFVIGYFVGYSSLPVVIVLTFLIGLLLGAPLVLRTSMLADTVEYAELKTGKRSEGIIFSTLTFTGKLKLGLSAFFVGLVLDLVKYIPNAVQTAQSLNGIYMMLTLIPAFGSIITVIPLFFYKLSEDEHKRIVEELGD